MYDASLMTWMSLQKIWVYSQTIDFRKQLNGLIHVVLDEMEKSPDDGSIYIFQNRQQNTLKMLLWDRNGYFMGYKRLEKGKFYFPKNKDGTISVTSKELYELVSGMPIIRFSALNQALYHH